MSVLFVKNYLQFAAGEDNEDSMQDAYLKHLAEKKRSLSKRKLPLQKPKTSTSEDEPLEVLKKKRHDDSKKYTNTCIFV